jgi:hypothetical protein
MAIVRGLKALLHRTAPSKLVRSQTGTCYRLKGASGKGTGPRLVGVAKKLSSVCWKAKQDDCNLNCGKSSDRTGSAWRGKGGGLRRGTAVDAQVTKCARMSAAARAKTRMYALTRTVFAALDHHGLAPFDAQRCVADAKRRLGTAADVVCQRGSGPNAEVVLVEIKCGYSGGQKKAVLARAMKAPLQNAKDTHVHRHLAQLSATLALFEAEKGTMKALKAKGIGRVDAALLYVDDTESTMIALPSWWRRRGDALLETRYLARGRKEKR